VKDLRKTMRNQALRCHVLYSHDGTKLNLIPVLASRSQALRFDYSYNCLLFNDVTYNLQLSKIIYC
jgi:sucrose-phosphate synthase